MNNLKSELAFGRHVTYYQKPVYDPCLDNLDDDIRNEYLDNDDSMQFLIDYDSQLRYSMRSDSGVESNFQCLMTEYSSLKYTYIRQGWIFWHFWQDFAWQESKCRKFTEFCVTYLQLPFWRVRQTINAAAIATDLMKLGFTNLPLNESQCEVLSVLRNETDDGISFEDKLTQVWRQVIKLNPVDLTCKNIKHIIKLTYPYLIPTPKTTPLQLDTQLVNEYQLLAMDQGVTIPSYLQSLVYQHSQLKEQVSYLQQEAQNNDKLMDKIRDELLIFHGFKTLCQKYDFNYILVLKELIIDKNFLQSFLETLKLKPLFPNFSYS